MRAAHYPQFAEHQEQHAAMLRDVKDMQSQFKQGTLSQLEFMKLLKNWMTQHILKTDKQYVPYSVSYTHLDVYKRQCKNRRDSSRRRLRGST